MTKTERPDNNLLSARSAASAAAVSASPEELSNLQQLLNKCEVELEAKSHLVEARDEQIQEFKDTIERLQKQVLDLNKNVDVD